MIDSVTLRAGLEAALRRCCWEHLLSVCPYVLERWGDRDEV